MGLRAFRFGLLVLGRRARLGGVLVGLLTVLRCREPLGAFLLIGAVFAGALLTELPTTVLLRTRERLVGGLLSRGVRLGAGLLLALPAGAGLTRILLAGVLTGVLLTGDLPPNPAELLPSGRMIKLSSLLLEHYVYVIIDTPPVDVVVDAVALSSMCDGVLFVVRSDQSERGAVMHGIEQLQYAGVNVLGFVLNGVTADSAGTYAKFRYGSYGRSNRN